MVYCVPWWFCPSGCVSRYFVRSCRDSHARVGARAIVGSVVERRLAVHVYRALVPSIGMADSSVHRTACDAVCDAVSASYLGDVQESCRTLARVAIEATGTFASAGLAMARKLRYPPPVGRATAESVRRTAEMSICRRLGDSRPDMFDIAGGLRFALAQPATDQQTASPDEVNSVTPGKVFEDVVNTYKSMDTYKAEGTVIVDMDTGATKTNIETSFSIA